MLFFFELDIRAACATLMFNMDKLVIAVDFDDVVADFNRAFLTHHNENYGTNVVYESINVFDLGVIYNIDRQTFVERAQNFCHTLHNTIKPIEGAQFATRNLSEIYDLQIVTSRWDSLDEITRDWLEEWFPKTFSAIHFVNNHPHEQNQSKHHTCINIGAQVLIDDALHHVTEAVKNGVPSILMNRPWNQGPLPTGIARVNNWEDTVTWIHKNIKK